MARKRSVPLGSPSPRHVARFEKGVDALNRALHRANSAALTGDCAKAHTSLVSAGVLVGRLQAEKLGAGSKDLEVPALADAQARFSAFCGFQTRGRGVSIKQPKRKK